MCLEKNINTKSVKPGNRNDTLSVEGISLYLAESDFAENIFVYKTIDSTSNAARKMISGGTRHGTVLISDTQTAGKGRQGRKFFSPSQSGLYMSLIMQSSMIELPAMSITAAAAVTVCNAIQAVCEKNVKIKWLNDILLHDKKVCGILTEAIAGPDGCEWFIVGIGINIDTKIFPDELKNIAGSIYSDEAIEPASVRNRLAAEIINRAFTLNDWLDEQKIYSEYKNRMSMLGCAVTVSSPTATYNAIAVGIDEKCRLIVEKPDGEHVALSSGEVSVRAE